MRQDRVWLSYRRRTETAEPKPPAPPLRPASVDPAPNKSKRETSSSPRLDRSGCGPSYRGAQPVQPKPRNATATPTYWSCTATIRTLAARAPKPATGVAALTSHVHTGDLADFVTIESAILPLIPVPEGGGWKLLGRLVVPRAGIVPPPWGAVWWSWPAGAVIGRVRIEASGSAEPWRPDPQRLAEARAELERVLAAPPESADLDALGARYAVLLPQSARAAARALAGCGWLG
ncbi:MAG: hypothetical protein Q8P18_16250 [Pseudomonadota bacterium]|nr:hypothetical protein [Pseudomonadota bacterium]